MVLCLPEAISTARNGVAPVPSTLGLSPLGGVEPFGSDCFAFIVVHV
jgi:hypothetical protein